MTPINWLAIWFLASVVAAPFIGHYLHNRRVNRDFRGHLDTEARRVRLAKLVQLANEYDAATTVAERERIYREAAALTPRDPALEVARIAFETGRPVIGNVDDKGTLSIEVLAQPDDAFALDEPTQPRRSA